MRGYGWLLGLSTSLLLTPHAAGQAAKKTVILPGAGQYVRVLELKAGQEAKIIAANDMRRDPEGPEPPETRLGLYVFDAHGNCVAWDDFAPKKGTRDSAVTFVPPESGRYTVVVRNFAAIGYPIRLTTP
jgi:hypothetical protein